MSLEYTSNIYGACAKTWEQIQGRIVMLDLK